MRIFGINNFNYNQTNTFKAKKISKSAEKFVSEKPSKLLSAAMASIGMAGIALNMNNEKSPIRGRKPIEIDEKVFMEVYNSKGTLEEKAQKLGLSLPTYRRMITRKGLEFIPQHRGHKLIEIDENLFMEVYNSKGTLTEKAKKLGISIWSYRHLLDIKGLEFIPQQRGYKPMKIDEDLLMEVYNSQGTLDEKAEKLGISITTLLRLLEKRNLKHIPSQRGPKVKFNFTKNALEEIYFSKLSLQEKLDILGLSSNQMLYRYLGKFGIKKTKAKDITEEEFKKVFNMKIPLSEKLKILDISSSSYYILTKKYNCMTTEKFIQTITKEDFESVYNQNITLTEKCKKLGITRGTYLSLAKKFGFHVEVAPATYIRSKDIPVEKFIEVYNKSVPVAEKCEELGISHMTYIKRAKELGLKQKNTFHRKTDLSKITLEDFLKVYNDSSLTINQKCLKLGISDFSYFKLVRKWNLQRSKGIKE